MDWRFRKLPALRFLPLVSMAYKKLAMVVLGSLFALFLSYGSIIIFFLTSSDWSLPIELSSGHELVVRAERDLGEMKVRQNQVSQALNAAETAIAVAERSKSDARLRLDIAKRSIELELSQQHKVLYATKEQIVRLRKIINDFRNQTGRGSYANNLDAAYANRTITKKAMEAGTLAVLETLHRMAIVANDLGMMEIEESRINTRVEFLNSLKEQLDKPEIRILAAATPELVYLARDAIADQNVISEADEMIANQTAEAAHLSDSLSVVSSNIKIIADDTCRPRHHPTRNSGLRALREPVRLSKGCPALPLRHDVRLVQPGRRHGRSDPRRNQHRSSAVRQAAARCLCRSHP